MSTTATTNEGLHEAALSTAIHTAAKALIRLDLRRTRLTNDDTDGASIAIYNASSGHVAAVSPGAGDEEIRRVCSHLGAEVTLPYEETYRVYGEWNADLVDYACEDVPPEIAAAVADEAYRLLSAAVVAECHAAEARRTAERSAEYAAVSQTRTR